MKQLNVKRAERHLSSNRIASMLFAMAIVLVASGVPWGAFGILEDGVEAQTTTVNFVTNLGLGMVGVPPPGVGNLPDSTTTPTMVSKADQQSAIAFTTGGDLGSNYTITEVEAELLQLGTHPFSPVLTLHADESGDPADAVLHTFTNPNPIPPVNSNVYASWTFTATGGYQVAASTTYHLKFSDAVTSATTLQFYYLGSINESTEVSLFDPEDSSSGSSGWLIAHASKERTGSNGTWTNVVTTKAIGVGIRGTVETPGVTIDTDPATAGVQSDKLVIEEGMTDTYTVALNSAPSTEVTVTPTVPTGLSISPTSLTFSTTDFGAKTFTVTAEHDTNLVSETGLNITHAVSGYGTITTADAVTVDVTEDDAAGVTVDTDTTAGVQTAMTVNEGGTATYSVVLDFQPAADVTVTPSVTTGRGLTLNPTSLTFTDSNWDMPQDVTVTAADDSNRSNETATITHTSDETGAGTAYDLVASAIDNISVTVNDNDTITLSVSTLTVAEGATGSYTVVLAQAPSSTVTVRLSLSADIGLTIDTDSGMSGVQDTLTFTTMNWSTTQTVEVVAPQDDDGFSNTGMITHSVSGGGLSAMAVLSTSVTEDETVGVVLGGSAALVSGGDSYTISVNEGTSSGASNEYTVQLASQPYPSTANVEVAITAPSGPVTLKKAGETTGSKTQTLTFTGTNWNTPQTVTVEAAQDPDSQNATNISVSHVATGANFAGASDSTRQLDVTVVDDDSPNLILSATALDVTETNATTTETYTVKLATQPSDDVTLTLTQPTNTDVTVDTDSGTAGDQTELTFTMSDWNSPKTVTVNVAHDATADNETATIVHSFAQSGGEMEYASLGDVMVNVTIADDETAAIPAPPSSFNMTEMADGTTVTGPLTYRLTLGTQPTSPVTITMTVVSVTPAPISGVSWTNPDISVTGSVELNASNYMAGETVTITLTADSDAEDDVARITYAVAQSGGAMEYDGAMISPTTVNIADMETAAVEFKPLSASVWSTNVANLTIDDGGTLTLDARLSHQPRGDVTLNLMFPSGSNLAATAQQLMFSRDGWSPTQQQDFQLTHTADDNSFSETYTLDFSVTGYGSGTVQDQMLTVDDKDPVGWKDYPGYVDGFNDNPAEITVTEGGSNHTYHPTPLTRPSNYLGRPAFVTIRTASSNPATLSVIGGEYAIQPGSYADGAEVTIRGLEDDNGVNDTVTLTHTVTSEVFGRAGNYHNTQLPDVLVTIMDDDAPELIFENAAGNALTIAENVNDTPATRTFKVKLATEPTDEVMVTIVDPTDNSDVSTSPETLTFNSSNWRMGQDVTVTAVADLDTVNDMATIMFTTTQTGDADPHDEYEGLTVTPIAVTVTDPDRSAAVLKVSDSEVTTLTVLEESTATYDVSLSHQPDSGDTLTVTLTVSGSGTKVTLDNASLTFTSSNWDAGQTVTVTGVADANLVNDTFTVGHAVTGTRASTTATNLRVTRTDNDAPNLDLSGVTALTVTEGASDSYDIELTQQPSATVTLTVAVTGNDDVRFSTDSCTTLMEEVELEFTTSNWDSTQSLTVCAKEDYDAADETASLTYSASGGGYGSLTYPSTPVTVDDDDTESAEISVPTLAITEVEGGVATATYDVSLTAAPTGGNVTVTIAVPNNPDVTTDPRTLTFRPGDWDGSIPLATPTVTKSVEVRVVDDDGAGDDTAEIRHTLSGVNYAEGELVDSIDVNVTDTDIRGVTIAAADPFSFDEGGSATYTVVLDTEPTGQVEVEIEDAVPTDEIRTDKTALQFDIDDWDTPQTVRVSAERDDDAQDDTGTITHTVSGADYGTNNVTAGSVSVTVNDSDSRSVILRVGGVENPPSPAFSIGEGSSEVEYEIKLGTKPVNANDTDGEVTITVTTSNSSELRIRNLENISIVDSLTLTFDATNWNVYQTLSILAPDEPGDTSQDMATIMHAVSGADYGANNETVPDIAVTINDDDSPSFSTSAESLNITEGTSSAYSVVLDTLPVGGNVTITVTVGSNPDIRLVDSDTNDTTELVLEFTTSDWDTAQTVTVRVAEDPDALEDSGTIRHVASGANFQDRVTDVTMRVEVQETTVANVGVDPTRLTVTEGRTGTYDLVLESQPQSDVVITVSSSNSSKATVSPGRLTFTNSTWSVPQTITVSGVSDADANNDVAVVSHVSSGDIYDDLQIADVNVTVVEDGTAIRDTSSFLQSSSCEGEVRLTWNSPTTEEVAIDAYRIQWRTGKAQYSTSQSVTAMPDATSYTLTSLMNGTMYTIRVLGLDSTDEPVWSRETTATPSAQSCIAEVRFGNILADSTPVIVEVEDADPGTMVNMRYRSLNPGVWSEVQSKAVERGETTVTFDIRGLKPDNNYEVQTWLGRNTPPVDDRAESTPMAVAQTIFRTTPLPEGVTFFGGGGGGGSIARIGRIEPSILSVKLSAGDKVALSVEVWGRQGLLDNGLADKSPADGRPEIVWSSSGGGTFEEGRVPSGWSDGIANDRQVTFVAPDESGTTTVTASVLDSADCLSQQEDETSQEHEARCTAEIGVTVVRRVTAPIIVTAPVNPAGVIPQTLSDSEGVAYAVFTPVEGGSFAGDGYSLVAGAGAVANGEYIGVSMASAGDASNVGMTWHRYTLGGLRYAISVVDAGGEALSDYGLNEAITACVPLPPELRGNISDIVLAAADAGGGTAVLSTSIKIASDGVSVCGKLSTLPATVAVGKVGSPPEVVDPAEEVVEDPLPDTGGFAPLTPWLIWLALAGMFVTAAGLAAVAVRRGRRLF